jgi:glutathione synthase/RimK-type ligase-like ATP-grasp enzyme
MNPILAIHDRDDSFAARWYEYCESNEVPYVKLNMYNADFIFKLRQSQAKGFLFQLPLYDLKTQLFAANIARAVELMGIKVFPCDTSYWHFDDKVAQKYLFESLDIPMCPTWVFYEKEAALKWVASASYPKIFKLRRGAGSYNVQMVKSEAHAKSLVKKMFNGGVKPVSNIMADYKTKLYKHKKQRDWMDVLKRLPGTLDNIRKMRTEIPREKGYIYFQEFFPGNDHDTRVTVIGDRAFAFRRFTRPNDFRASGSGRIDWDPQSIDLRCIELAFGASRRIKSQCLAFDFVYDTSGNPAILEVCYTFIPQAVFDCSGHWDPKLNFHEGHLWPQDAIISDMLLSIRGD